MSKTTDKHLPHLTRVQWQDPKGVFHEKDERGDYSWVEDLDDLIRDHTVQVLPVEQKKSAPANFSLLQESEDA